MTRANRNQELPTPGASGELLATAPVIARWLGITGKAVYDLAKAGVLVRHSRDQFLLEESVRRYCEHIRGSALRQDHAEPTESFDSNVDGAT